MGGEVDPETVSGNVFRTGNGVTEIGLRLTEDWIEPDVEFVNVLYKSDDESNDGVYGSDFGNRFGVKVVVSDEVMDIGGEMAVFESMILANKSLKKTFIRASLLLLLVIFLIFAKAGSKSVDKFDNTLNKSLLKLGNDSLGVVFGNAFEVEGDTIVEFNPSVEL